MFGLINEMIIMIASSVMLLFRNHSKQK